MERLIAILRKIKPEVDFTKCSDFVDEGIFDSIDIVTIIDEIESEYGVEIQPEDIDPDNFQSLENMIEMIERISK